MTTGRDRRAFLAEVGKGMLAAGVGVAVATDLELLPRGWANQDPRKVTFGDLEPLVGLMGNTPANKLLPLLAAKLKEGTDLRTLTAAAALANVRAFGGTDYHGFHTFMALAPALAMAGELPKDRAALPVFKVIYRNTARIQSANRLGRDMVEALIEEHHPTNDLEVRDAIRANDWKRAEGLVNTLAREEPGEAFRHLQFAIQDEVDVHRVVLAWRSWATLDLTGKEHAAALLRQTVRYCIAEGEGMSVHPGGEVRKALAKLLDQYRLPGTHLGTRAADDAWVAQLAETILTSRPETAAEAAAAALAEGFSPAAIGEAMSLAATQLVLRDPGRSPGNANFDAGSVHGASVGVHAADSANAWRNIASVSGPRHAAASLIVGAFHTAGQLHNAKRQPWPWAEHDQKIQTDDPTQLLKELDDAVRQKDQGRACAAAARYGRLGRDARPVFDVLLGYAVSEEGALHAEKYYRTVSEEFARTRPALRWAHLVTLARVTASEYGRRAPGYDQARQLLGA